MDVGLLAFDLDGTTLVRHQFISEANQRAFGRRPAGAWCWCRLLAG